MLIAMLITTSLQEIKGTETALKLGVFSTPGTKFVQNVGQMPDDILFYSIHPYNIYIFKDGRIFISGNEIHFNSSPRFVVADMKLKTVFSYFVGGKSFSGLPTYKRIILKELYPSTDLLLTVDGYEVVELQFIVHPGGNPSNIGLSIMNGNIVIRDSSIFILKGDTTTIRIHSIHAYQGADEIDVKAHITNGTIKFAVGEYDKGEDLIIDPIVTTAILSSSGFDAAEAVEVDRNGNVFITGYTTTYSDFSSSRTIFPNSGGVRDVFISKLSSDLSVHYATAIIGSSSYYYYTDWVEDIAIDSSGNVVIVGRFAGPDFGPSTGRVYFGPVTSGAFITMFNNDLTTHIRTAFIGGSGENQLFAVAIDALGYIYVVGWTRYYLDYAPSRTLFGSGYGDWFAVVSKLSPDLSTHIATAVISSQPADSNPGILAYDLDIDGDGNVFITGYVGGNSGYCNTCLPDVTPLYVYGTYGGTSAFVTKLNGDLSAHLGTAVLTGTWHDYGHDVHVDSVGNVFVSGTAMCSSTFAPHRIVFGTATCSIYSSGAYVTKLSNDLSSHIETAILGSPSGSGAVEAIPSNGSIFVAGNVQDATSFIPGSVIFGTTGGMDVFITKLSGDLSSHEATAILAGSGVDAVGDNGLYVRHDCRIYVAGITKHSTDFSTFRIYYGTPSISDTGDAFVSTLPCPLGFSDDLSVYENNKLSNRIEISKNYITVYLFNPSYVGYNLYSADGRLVERKSLGYLPKGKYTFELKYAFTGTYVLKVRIGNRIVRKSLVIR